MAETDSPLPLERIEHAIARIEAAVANRTLAEQAMARRHAELKARMAEAVNALDEVITRGVAG